MSLARQAATAVREFASDHRSGSAELALQACGILEKFAPDKDRSPEAFGFRQHLAQTLAAAQPSMAAVLNVCNRWLAAAERGEPPKRAAPRIASELQQAPQAVAHWAAGLILPGATVLTYSYSATVLAALLASWKRGCRFRVLCSEGRPLFEGRALAERLAKKKIPVDLFTDAAFFSALETGDLVLVGCDAIQSRWLVNKVGTAALLGLARRARIPSYVIADSFKFLPPKLEKWFQIRPQAAREVWRARHKNVTVHNLYFEKVPLRDGPRIITEEGIWPPGAIRGLLQKVEVAAGFRQVPNRQER